MKQTYKVWYSKRFVGFRGTMPKAATVSRTHVEIAHLEAECLEDVYRAMQAENWSPSGEARETVIQAGTDHTSMSVGDVVYDGNGKGWVVAEFGFEELR